MTSFELAEAHISKCADIINLNDPNNQFSVEKSTNKRERGEYTKVIDLVSSSEDDDSTIASTNILTSKRQRQVVLTHLSDTESDTDSVKSDITCEEEQEYFEKPCEEEQEEYLEQAWIPQGAIQHFDDDMSFHPSMFSQIDIVE
jgi:hypothetical protein